MKKKIRLKLLLSNFFISIICLSVAAYSVFLFWKDLNLSTERNDKTAIAKIEFKQRIAQRKFSDRVVWERLQNFSPIYNEDTVRTSSQSVAVITFKNNASIEIHENTMLQIFYSPEEGLSLSVGEGNIDVDTSNVTESGKENQKDAVISLKTKDGSVLNVSKGSKVSSSVNEDSSVSSFNVQSGSASVEKKGQKVKLNEGEVVKIEENGSIEKAPINVTSISSNFHVLNFEEEAVPVKLEWTSSENLKNKPVTIQVSREKDFSTIQNTYVVEDDNSFTLPAQNGTLYWKLFVEEEEPVEGKIHVDNVEDLNLISPASGAAFSYKKNLPRINFNWNDNQYAVKYKFELSQTADFSKLTEERELTDNSLILSSLKEGQYYWRVTPYYNVNNTGFTNTSKINTFTITKNDKVLPPALTLPAQNSSLTYQAKDFNVTFLWKSEEENADYTLLISKDEDFSNLVYQEKLQQKRLFKDFSKELATGEYFWKVISDSDGEELVSEVNHFSVIKYVPARNRLLFPPENYSVEQSKVSGMNFIWKLSDDFEGSESILEISKDDTFKNPLVTKKSELMETSGFDLKKDSYYWRVGVYNPSDASYVYTDARKFIVLGELASPVITYPQADENLVCLADTALNVKWNKVPEADFYKVKITDKNNSEKVYYDKNVTSEVLTDFTLPEEINNGTLNLELSVQAFTNQNELSEMRYGKRSVSQISVRAPDRVKLIYPSDNVRIDGLSALRKPVQLQWKTGLDKAEKATLVVKKVMPSGSVKEVTRIANAKPSENLKRLSSGTYRWTVYASSQNGLPLEPLAEASFVITSVPKLKTPKLSLPANNFIIDSDYLRKNRQIAFEWNPVTGASDYTFALYKKGSDGKLKRIYVEKNIKNTSVKFKKLSDLDIGSFEWRVTAYCHAKDGFEEQLSDASANRFSIKFDLPSAITTNDPGKVYGE